MHQQLISHRRSKSSTQKTNEHWREIGGSSLLEPRSQEFGIWKAILFHLPEPWGFIWWSSILSKKCWANVFILFPVDVIRCSDESSSVRLYCGPWFRVQSIMAGKSCQLELEGAAHLASAVKTQTGSKAPLLTCSAKKSRVPCRGISGFWPQLDGSSTSFSILSIFPHKHVHRPIFWVILVDN